MTSGQSVESPRVTMGEDYFEEHTHSLRSLLRERLKKKFQGLAESPSYVPMKLYLFTGKNEGIKTEQEVEGLKYTTNDFLKDENVIKYDKLFKPCPFTNKDVRTVLMKGISGIGKTTAIKKFVLDWTEDKTHQDITFVLPFNLTELSSMKTKKISLIQLLGWFFPELTDTETLKHAKVLFVLDELSKCRLKLNFWYTKSCGDPAKELSLSALLVNLVRGDLFPNAQIWVTSNSEEADFIPCKYVQRTVEIQGLDDVEWEDYVRRVTGDSSAAARAIIHMKSSNSLYFMRSQPLFCRIAASVLEELMTNTCNTELPVTLTEMYTYFLIIQMKRKPFHRKAEVKLMKIDAKEILELGKLAWHTLEKGTLTVLEEDLREYDIVPSAAAQLSQRWPAFFEEGEQSQGKAYHFVHRSIQAYLSALYVVVKYGSSKGNVLNYALEEREKAEAPPNMHRRAVDKALSSKEGKFNFFLTFLLGISAGPSYKYLSCFIPDTCQQESSESIVPYIFDKIENSSSLNMSANLIRCLDELNVSYPVGKNETQKEGPQKDITPSEWCALAKSLLNSEDQQRILDIREYLNPDVAFMRLLPIIKSSTVLRLCECSDLSWLLLASALRSTSNIIREINIEDHLIQESNIRLLSNGLKSPNCKVEILRTPHHYYDGKGEPDPLISALLTNSTHLRELNLSNSYVVSDKTVEDLTKILVDSGCHLEKLVLRYNCRLTANSFKALARALRSSTCHLKELDLSHSYKLRDEDAVPLLCEGLRDPCCQIRALSLESCSITQKGFAALVSALSLNPSHLRQLDLSYSRPGLQAFRQLCSLLENPNFKLEMLRMVNTELWQVQAPPGASVRQNLTETTSEVFKALGSALRSSNLRVLDLSINKLEDSSVELLSTGLSHFACKLEVLRMARCNITEVGASVLANALHLNPSYLRELDLSYNPVEDTGFNQLNSLVVDPAFKLEKIITEGVGEKHSIEVLQQYECSLTLNPNTAAVNVQVSEGDKEAWNCRNPKPLQEHLERFKVFSQVMCREGLTGRHFCQVEWFGRFASIGMAYKDISRKGHFTACSPGHNKKSWAINVSTPLPLCEALHDGVKTQLPDCCPWRVGVYLNWSAGTLSFYDITHDKAELIHTFYAKFTGPLFLVFSISAGIRLLPSNPSPVCIHDHDPWDMLRGVKDCKGCNGSKAG